MILEKTFCLVFTKLLLVKIYILEDLIEEDI